MSNFEYWNLTLVALKRCGYLTGVSVFHTYSQINFWPSPDCLAALNF